MRLDDGRESDNVEDMRGASGGGMPIGRGGLGIGAIVVAFAASYFLVSTPALFSDYSRGIRL
jgi:predicted metalloprotease